MRLIPKDQLKAYIEKTRLFPPLCLSEQLILLNPTSYIGTVQSEGIVTRGIRPERPQIWKPWMECLWRNMGLIMRLSEVYSGEQ